MPPKKQDKAQQEKKKKVAEDKTFGLKNKNKSAKVKQYVAQVQAQASNKGNQGQKAPPKKEQEEKTKAELNELFKPVQLTQKVPFGTDPKTVLCQFFKAGTCTKGKNCKFSHDVNVERKSQKIDLYTDSRAIGEKEKKEDLMENWDQAKLEEVVSKNHGGAKANTTDIVCKFFLKAVEEKKYGWFWICPNGDECKYRHALPPGFVLNENKNTKDKENIKSLEEWVEEERQRLVGKLTPVTLESFNQWKKDRKEAKEKEEKDRNAELELQAKAGRALGGASGRELFQYNPDLFNLNNDEDEDAWDGAMEGGEEEEEEEEGVYEDQNPDITELKIE